jgi:hypothetical protein
MQRIRSTANAEFARWRGDYAAALTPRLDAGDVDLALADMGRELGGLLSQMPDPGPCAPTMRAFSVAGALYVAMFLALRPRGFDAPRAWEVCDDATRRHFARMGWIERTLASAGMFSAPMRWLARSLESRSKSAPVGGWVARFVPPEGGYDFGVDYSRCAIRDLALRAGAAEFAPYICLADIAGSEAFGWGLVRTETLAQGGTRCDFRFRRGGETRVTTQIPSTTETAG